MKKIGMILAFALLAFGGIYAETAQPAKGDAKKSAIVEVSGPLSFVNGRIAVVSGDKTYYLGGIQTLLGFVDGLKEGSVVKTTGYAAAIPAAPEYQFLRLTRLTFNGKAYDFPEPSRKAASAFRKARR
jgi:hypothetical protein